MPRRAPAVLLAPGHLSLYQRVWFFPTKAQQRAGARWISCEVGLISHERLVPLPEQLLPATGRPDDSSARCGRASYVFVVCSEKHAYQIAHTVAVGCLTQTRR